MISTPLTPAPLPPLQHILVPYDFSDGARLALQYAMTQAQQFPVEITLLHVVHLPFRGVGLSPGEPHATEGLLLAEASKQLSELVEELKRQEVAAKAVVHLGYPGPEIAELARQESIDLIIMGTHGRTGLSHTLLGSVAENVVRHAPCPVLVVRSKTHEVKKK